MIEDMVQRIVSGRCGLDLHGVFEVAAIAGLDVVAECRARGVKADKAIAFDVEDQVLADQYQQSQFHASGLTTLIVAGAQAKPVVFVKQSVTDDKRFDRLLRYGLVLHELGHANDMIKGVNFRKGSPVSLQAAEAYAEVFCLRRLNDTKDEMSEVTRNLFAARLCRMNGAGTFKQGIYDAAIQQMSRGKLSKWASKAIRGVEFT